MIDPSTARFNIVLGQRQSWPEMLTRFRETETLGFDGFYLVDHFFGLQDVNQPTHEAYTMLAALAPFSQRLRLGIMVCGNTYRNPAFLLKQAVTVDHISGGRVDFGVGAGWLEREHGAYGFPFPSARERVDRFAEALEIWDLLQRQERTTYDGTYYQIADAPFEPKPLQSPRLPMLIGGSGPRMLKLIARHADIWNMVAAPDEVGEVSGRLDAACEAIGRDPSEIVRSVSPSINLLASPDAFAEGVRAYWAAGIRDISFPWPRVDAELPVLREVARNVIPELRGRAGSMSEPIRLEAFDSDAVKAVVLGLDEPSRALLAELAKHTGEPVETPVLLAATGIDSQASLTRALAAIGRHFSDADLPRPWVEAQRGYVMPSDRAEVIRSITS